MVQISHKTFDHWENVIYDIITWNERHIASGKIMKYFADEGLYVVSDDGPFDKVGEKEVKWVPRWEKKDGTKSNLHMCSNCKRDAYIEGMNEVEILSPFCPYCGSKMKNSKIYICQD